MGAKFWRRESRNDLQEKRGPGEDRGNKETSNLQIVSCSACLGCGRGERFHPFIQKAWTDCSLCTRCHARHWGHHGQPKQRLALLVWRLCVHLQKGGEKSTPHKKKKMNMTLQIKMSTLKEDSTRIAPRNQSKLGGQEVFLRK